MLSEGWHVPDPVGTAVGTVGIPVLFFAILRFSHFQDYNAPGHPLATQAPKCIHPKLANPPVDYQRLCLMYAWWTQLFEVIPPSDADLTGSPVFAGSSKASASALANSGHGLLCPFKSEKHWNASSAS
jgi:hypothetical protein